MDLMKSLAVLAWIFILSGRMACSECSDKTSLTDISGTITTREKFEQDDECIWNFDPSFTTTLIKIDVTYFMVEEGGQCGTNQKGYLVLPGNDYFCTAVPESSPKCFYFYKNRNPCVAQITANGECEEWPITTTFFMKYYSGNNHPGSGINFNYQMIDCDAELNAKCFGQIISNVSGIIKSPNNGKEYGEPANCSWNFKPEFDDRKYILTLTVVKLKTYFNLNEKRHCPGSYILAINGRTMDCDRFVPKSNFTQSFCHQFYSPSCLNTPISNCEVSEAASFPVNVTYFSDGRTGDKRTNYMGFNIQYNYTPCADQTTTAGILAPTDQNRSPKAAATTKAEPQNQNSTAIIAGVVGGVVCLLLLATVAIVCVKRNKSGGKANNVEDEHQLTQQKQQPHDASMTTSSADTYDVLQRGVTSTNTTYSTVGGAASINDNSTAMYATIGENEPNTPNANYETVGEPGASFSNGVDMSITEGVATSITSPDAVYSAVQKGGADKGTVHYSKITVDNVLYGSTA